MIPNEEKERCHCLAVKKLSALFHEITSKHEGDFFLLGFSSFFQKKIDLNLAKKYLKIKIFVEL